MTGIILKPWGREYCAYRNEHVAIWVLEIRKGEATSLHAHPSKNTALIVLRGEVELSFIRGEPRRFVGLDKINIFRGRFHRTRAISDDVVMLEVEAPDSKSDIVRLEDDYGRADQPIETEENGVHYRLAGTFNRLADCELVIDQSLLGTDERTIIVTLEGGLYNGLLPPGDAIDGASMARLARAFSILPNSLFLDIRQTT